VSARIAIASGGTGGHFFPTLAIARELERRAVSVDLLVAGRHAHDQLELAARSGLRATETRAFRLPSGLWSALCFPWRFSAAVRAARERLHELAPDLLLGMGSFAAVPACLAARQEGIPLVLHEGNAWMGRANRFLSRWAVEAGLSLPLVEGCRVSCPTVHTGMPLREALVAAAQNGAYPQAYAAAAGLTRERRTLLVFGGSQGARFLNDVMCQAGRELGDGSRRLQVIHLTGTDENAPIAAAYRAAGIPASVRRADPDIQNAYLAADLVICRAGASSICELALFGRPAILIPLPSAAENHQTANAQVIAARQGAVHLPQAEATPTRLAALLTAWLAAGSRFAAMGEAIRGFAVPNAAAQMADLCLRRVRVRPAGR
jgi:UDP-N-acetylglucosamine--N-acetylmuramyl-(pentapeptide) pyrophosphoryl-undecaprenol N-acetylglucosamine transferase